MDKDKIKEVKARCDRRLYERKRDLLFDALGRECVKCGSKDNIEFDHIDPVKKSFTILSEWKRPLEELLEEVKKCQPLCETCHAEKTSEQLGVAHGGGKSGKRGCKCEPCRKRKAEYAQRYRTGEPRKPPQERLKDLHGTRAGYLLERRLGMERCALCKAANTEYSKKLRTK